MKYRANEIQQLTGEAVNVARLPILVLVILLSACAHGPRLDTSSSEALNESVDEMTAGMDATEGLQFRRKLSLIMLTETCGKVDHREQSEEKMLAPLHERVNGLTAEQVWSWELSEEDKQRAAACAAH